MKFSKKKVRKEKNPNNVKEHEFYNENYDKECQQRNRNYVK